MKSAISMCLLLVSLPAAYGGRVAVEPIGVDASTFGGPSQVIADAGTGEHIAESRDLVFDISNTWTLDFGLPVELVGFTNDVSPGLQLESLKFYSDLALEPIGIVEVTGAGDQWVFADFEPILAQYVVWESRPIYEPFGEPSDGLWPLMESIQYLKLKSTSSSNNLSFFAVPEPIVTSNWLAACLVFYVGLRRVRR